jgi:hypothetical protein
MGKKREIDIEEITNYLKDKWKVENCPICGKNDWIVSTAIFELREFNKGNLIVGEIPLYPVLPITCDNCG